MLISAAFPHLRNAALCIAFVTLPTTTLAQHPPPQWLSVDLPHGGCRLMLRQGGAASLSYGALPRSVEVQEGALDFDHVLPALLARALPQSERKNRPEGQVFGGLVLSADGEVLLIDDQAFVRGLIERAWGGRMPPMSAREFEDRAWIAKLCALDS